MLPFEVWVFFITPVSGMVIVYIIDKRAFKAFFSDTWKTFLRGFGIGRRRHTPDLESARAYLRRARAEEMMVWDKEFMRLGGTPERPFMGSTYNDKVTGEEYRIIEVRPGYEVREDQYGNKIIYPQDGDMGELSAKAVNDFKGIQADSIGQFRYNQHGEKVYITSGYPVYGYKGGKK